MKRRRCVSVCVALLLAAAGQTTTASTLDRTLDPVVLKGTDLIDCFTGPSPDEPGITAAAAGQYWNRMQEPLVIVVERVDDTYGYSSAANAEAAAYGSETLTGSGVVNGLVLLLIPVGAVLFLRIRRGKV